MDNINITNSELKSQILRQGALNKISQNLQELKQNVADTNILHYQPSDGDVKLITESIDIALRDLTDDKRRAILRAANPAAGAGGSSGRSNDIQPTAIATGELPSAKYLYQELFGGVSDDVYNRFCEECSAAEKYVPVGMGVEYTLEQHNEVSRLVETEFIPSARKDINNYMFWDNITLPGNDSIFKSTISIAPWRFAPYFLAGKLDEIIQVIVTYLSRTLKLKQSLDVINLIGQIYTNIDSQGTSEVTTSNKIVGTADNLVESVAEWKASLVNLKYHDNNYCYGTWDNSGTTPSKTAFTGYNNVDVNNLVHVIHPYTLNNLVKTNVINIVGGAFGEYADISKFKEWPLKIYNANITTEGNFGTLQTLTQIPRGVILSFDKEALKRVYNLEISKSQEYVPNLTTQYYVFKRYIQKYLKFGVCQVFKSAIVDTTSGLRALDAPLIINIKDNTPVTP